MLLSKFGQEISLFPKMSNNSYLEIFHFMSYTYKIGFNLIKISLNKF